MLKISEEMKKAHEGLAKTGIMFLEFIDKNPWVLKRSQYKNLAWPYRPLAFQPWPLFINQHFQEETAQAGIRVYNLIKQIPRKVFNLEAEKISCYFEIPKETVEYIISGVTESHIHHLLGRGDYIYSPGQGFKCLEYNIAGNLGGWELPFWHEMYRQAPPLAQFFAENSPELINSNLVEIALTIYIKHILEVFPYHENEINTAMIMATHQDSISSYPLENYSISKYREILHSINMNLEGELVVCDFSHLTLKKDCIFYKGKRILCLHENYGGVIPEEIINVYHRGNVILYVGPLTFLMSNKLNMALLSEHEESGLFTDEERRDIKKYIPWSRKTVKGQTRYRGEIVNLESFVLAHKEKFVLKSALGYGGKNILIGLHTPQREWEKMMETAFRKKTWLVQEYIEPSRYIFQEGEEGYGEHSTAWGIFVFGGSYAGTFLRTLPANGNKGIINAQQGAEVSLVFEVQE